MIRAAIYLRQSKDREGDELAVDRQREDCVALCETKGWTPVEYPDNDVSATNGKERKHYQRMLADIRAGRIDAVVVWDLDRLHRRPIELEEFMALADSKHLALATVSGDVDLSTAQGRLVARMKGSVAAHEMEHKSARQKRAAKQRAEMGTQWWSARPFGFAYTEADPDAQPPVPSRPILKDGQPTLDPVEAAEIRAAYTAVLAGSSLYAITTDWNARGVLTPRGNRWRGSQVRQLLTSPRNCALRTFGGEIIGKGNWPEIVAEDTWRAVADKLADPKRRTGITRARKHLLSNIAKCSECGSGMGSGVTKRPRQNPIYACKVCNKVSRSAAYVDELATTAVVARLSRPDALKLIQPQERGDLNELREKARALRVRLEGMAVEFADDVLSAAQIKTATVRINERLAVIEKTLADAQATHVFDAVIGVDDVPAAFDALSLDRKRAVIAALLEITIKPSGRCGRVFRPEDVEIVFRNC